MRLLRFDRMEALDVPRLMELYRESNLENVPALFPEEADCEEGLRRVEAGFRDFLETEFFQTPGSRYYVLEDRERWTAALRMRPVPGTAGGWYAEALETAPALRRRGYARRLMELCCYALAEEGPFTLSDRVSLHNEASLAFHNSVGFARLEGPALSPLSGESNPRTCGFCYRFAGWQAQRIRPEELSERYAVRRLTAAELPALLALCRSNPQFYRFCPPAPSEESLRIELAALPPRMTLNDKYYLGFYEGERLAAVLDLIPGFPKPEIAFWGFFMLDAAFQGCGRGSALVAELCAALKALGFRAVRLGWIEANPQASRFWRKNGFTETGAAYDTDGYTVTVGQKELT